jgi:hypothetical protein
MHVAHAGTSEVAIFGRVLEPDQATLDAAAARAILDLDFNQADKRTGCVSYWPRPRWEP